jgi:hypothetical protein
MTENIKKAETDNLPIRNEWNSHEPGSFSNAHSCLKETGMELFSPAKNRRPGFARFAVLIWFGYSHLVMNSYT